MPGVAVEPSGCVVGLNQRNTEGEGGPPDDPNDVFTPFPFKTSSEKQC